MKEFNNRIDIFLNNILDINFFEKQNKLDLYDFEYFSNKINLQHLIKGNEINENNIYIYNENEAKKILIDLNKIIEIIENEEQYSFYKNCEKYILLKNICNSNDNIHTKLFKLEVNDFIFIPPNISKS